MTSISDVVPNLETGASQKSFVEIQNPVQDAADVASVNLSDAANDALEGLQALKENLQTELDSAQSLREADLQADRSGASNGEQDRTNSLAEAQMSMREHMEVSIRVQQQLAQFVMVSSVSSSFGRNLNMFLRGQ